MNMEHSYFNIELETADADALRVRQQQRLQHLLGEVLDWNPFRTGDVVKLNRARCECGRTFARMNGGILGRADDMLTVRGVNIFPSAVENIVRRHSGITEFAAEVYKAEELDEMEIRIEVADGDAARVAGDLQHSLGLRMRVTPVPAGQLPRYELKARRFRDRR
jgi:phenylacetate-CoA ligase